MSLLTSSGLTSSSSRQVSVRFGAFRVSEESGNTRPCKQAIQRYEKAIKNNVTAIITTLDEHGYDVILTCQSIQDAGKLPITQDTLALVKKSAEGEVPQSPVFQLTLNPLQSANADEPSVFSHALQRLQTRLEPSSSITSLPTVPSLSRIIKRTHQDAQNNLLFQFLLQSLHHLSDQEQV